MDTKLKEAAGRVREYLDARDKTQIGIIDDIMRDGEVFAELLDNDLLALVDAVDPQALREMDSLYNSQQFLGLMEKWENARPGEERAVAWNAVAKHVNDLLGKARTEAEAMPKGDNLPEYARTAVGQRIYSLAYARGRKKGQDEVRANMEASLMVMTECGLMDVRAAYSSLMGRHKALMGERKACQPGGAQDELKAFDAAWLDIRSHGDAQGWRGVALAAWMKRAALAASQQAAEPVAWSYEVRQPHAQPEFWAEFFSREKPAPDNPEVGRWIRNVTPLYRAAPLQQGSGTTIWRPDMLSVGHHD